MSSGVPYDPLDYTTLGVNIRRELESASAIRMDLLNAFPGAKLYAIYYTGEHKLFPAYEQLALANSAGKLTLPIYVRKSDQATQTGLPEPTSTQKIYRRLLRHRASIEAASSTLDIRDFYCRWLVLVDSFIGLGEAQMIRLYRPVWNSPLRGFGNNPTGVPRESGKKSAWDSVHPGRTGVGREPHQVGVDTLLETVRDQIHEAVRAIQE
jgi:hypothetical protein